MLALFGLSAASAQAPDPLAPPAPKQMVPQGPTTPREPPSNEAAGIAVDRYVGDAAKSTPHIWRDVIYTRTILKEGDPDNPPANGAALYYHKEIAYAEMPAGNATTLAAVPQQVMLYIESGTARLDDGKSFWMLKSHSAVLIPPNQVHRLVTSDGAPLRMIMLTRILEPEVKPRDGILVRDVDALAMTERNVHWSNFAKYVFLGSDGLYPTDHMYIVYMAPRTIAGAHAHTPGQEEAWIKVTDGPALMQLGSEIRPWPINSGFLAPPNGKTVHAAINLSDETQAWFYISRLQPSASPPNPNRPPPPPAIAEGVARATVAGRPLKLADYGPR
jgi:mannose-6-phosphate isomerase-like protein (cupin superfamily)